MSNRSKEYYTYDEDFTLNLNQWQFLGKGHNGTVYLMQDGRVIKICNGSKSCKKEAYILTKVRGDKYFPRIYECGGNYMIREYVGGVCMKDYIKENGLSPQLSLKIIKLLQEFKKLNFTKMDIRCKDIFVQKDGSLMVIDPKGCYSRKMDFPRHLCKGLNKLEVLDNFMEVLKKEKPKLYKRWAHKIYSSLKNIK